MERAREEMHQSDERARGGRRAGWNLDRPTVVKERISSNTNTPCSAVRTVSIGKDRTAALLGEIFHLNVLSLQLFLPGRPHFFFSLRQLTHTSLNGYMGLTSQRFFCQHGSASCKTNLTFPFSSLLRLLSSPFKLLLFEVFFSLILKNLVHGKLTHQMRYSIANIDRNEMKERSM